MSIKECKCKQVQIVADSGMESRIVRRLNTAGITNYSVFDARGDDDSGWHSGQMDGDSNILIMLLLTEDQVALLRTVCQYYFERGHQLTVFMSDVEMISKDCM